MKMKFYTKKIDKNIKFDVKLLKKINNLNIFYTEK